MSVKKITLAAVVLSLGLLGSGCSGDSNPVVPDPVLRTIDRVFNNPGPYTFTFDRPAEIEIYALGAGGGGQGGHNKNYLIGSRDIGTGGAGGGGAAAYMRLSVEGPVTFDIMVGSGGSGGTSMEIGIGPDLQSGNSGNNGGASIVRWVSPNITLTAEGGSGGGGSGTSVTGGTGGRARPSDLPVSNTSYRAGNTAAGMNGELGTLRSEITSTGGRAATILSGSGAPFGGGNGARRTNTGVTPAQSGGGGSGGYNLQSGSVGGHGLVYIVVKYYE